MQARTLFFTAPGKVETRQAVLPPLTPGQVLVETICSAISPGSEMLVYRGQFPKGLADSHDLLSSELKYPASYGYACVGRVVRISKEMRRRWLGRLVFAFKPHTSHFIAAPDELFSVPDGMSPETACFLPNMETAVNLVQDAAPILGEKALVFGQGIVGLLTSALLAEFPLASLVTCDCYPLRRETSLSLDVSAAFDPNVTDFYAQARKFLPNGADLSIELSGAPAALNDAIAIDRLWWAGCNRFVVRREKSHTRPGRRFPSQPYQANLLAGQHDRAQATGALGQGAQVRGRVGGARTHPTAEVDYASFFAGYRRRSLSSARYSP